jgi:hypothetical protein
MPCPVHYVNLACLISGPALQLQLDLVLNDGTPPTQSYGKSGRIFNNSVEINDTYSQLQLKDVRIYGRLHYPTVLKDLH